MLVVYLCSVYFLYTIFLLQCVGVISLQQHLQVLFKERTPRKKVHFKITKINVILHPIQDPGNLICQWNDDPQAGASTSLMSFPSV